MGTYMKPENGFPMPRAFVTLPSHGMGIQAGVWKYFPINCAIENAGA